MTDEEFPESSGRRDFVKGVVGTATVTATGTAGATMVDTAADKAGEGGGAQEYFAIENTEGPAPRGMPMIPVEVDDGGYLKGVWPEVTERQNEQGRTVTVAETELGGVTYSSEWFQYCGVQSTPGVKPAATQDEYFRYMDDAYEWQTDAVSEGDRMHVDDFADFETWENGIGTGGLGKPAKGSWRSRQVPDEETIPIQVLRVATDTFDEMRQSAEHGEWLDAATDEQFVAWLDKCTHFCCVPLFKGTEQSSRVDGGPDGVYCPCHQSVYDPFSVVRSSFVALPRPDK